MGTCVREEHFCGSLRCYKDTNHRRRNRDRLILEAEGRQREDIASSCGFPRGTYLLACPGRLRIQGGEMGRRSRAFGSREYRRHPLVTLALLAVAVTLVAVTLGAVGAVPASAATFHRCSGKVKLDGGGTATHIKVRRVSCRRAR